jgi:hypothetical protein
LSNIVRPGYFEIISAERASIVGVDADIEVSDEHKSDGRTPAHHVSEEVPRLVDTHELLRHAPEREGREEHDSHNDSKVDDNFFQFPSDSD